MNIIKEIVHPKMKIHQLLTLKLFQTSVFIYCCTQRKIIGRMF